MNNDKKKSVAIGRALLSGPYLIWMIGFTIIPLALIFWYGITTKNGNLTLANITAIMSPDHWKALWLSLGLSLISTVLCLVLAYPLAMILRGRGSSLQNMFEVVAESLMHKFPKLNRVTVLVLLGALCLGFGIGMETISKWGPWMDLVSIYIIPIGATLGAVSWFYVMKKDALLDAINTGSTKKRGNLWYNVGRYVYVPLAIILCCVALFMHVAF